MMSRTPRCFSCYYLLLALYALAACGEDSDLPAEEPDKNWADPLGDLPNLGRVSFKQPQVGQRSIYLEFEEEFDRATGTISTDYTGDTLVLGIVGIQGDTLEIVEYYSKYSPIQSFDIDASGDQMLNISAELVLGDSLLIKPLLSYSYIFTLNQYLPFTDRLDTLSQHSSTIPVYDLTPQEWIARVDGYQIDESRLDSLIVYFDYTEMVTDGLGISLLFSIDLGVVRSAYISPWDSDRSYGWDLLFE